ncbi:hypothetical protein KBK19_03300 [Microvirga sp. STR05]|uniref:Uncharacterized protein n=1 Tax=Hymenobacter duratus TaxID=2771356 RepID=A0ABR8JEB9_9BACT|nr:hypothetical protein [Hymenobacter duratus]MBD2714056.1 hypothetical protein [Hymenobacter duratus]MBR7948958.1 hypothetical protein [Microvirga sp. STR05]
MYYKLLPLLSAILYSTLPPVFAQSNTAASAAHPVVVFQKPYYELGHSAWFKAKGALTPQLREALAVQASEGLQLRTLPDLLVQGRFGVQYARIYLVNPDPAPIEIERSDATVTGITLLFQSDGQWKSFKTLPFSVCGNSFWQDTLPSHFYMAMDIDVYTFFRGSIPTPCKAVAKIGSHVVESPVFTAQLTERQVQALRQP